MFIYACKYILRIDHHCKTNSELTETIKNSRNLLNYLQGVSTQVNQLDVFSSIFNK